MSSQNRAIKKSPYFRPFSTFKFLWKFFFALPYEALVLLRSSHYCEGRSEVWGGKFFVFYNFKNEKPATPEDVAGGQSA